MNWTLVGLTGVARSGKDTAAKILIEQGGFKRIALADPLRDMLFALNPIVYATYGLNHMRVQDLVNKHGWEGAKNVGEVRELLQRGGTEAGRGVFGENFWIEVAFKKIGGCEFAGCPCNRTVITDVRFANEAEAVVKNGGIVLRIVRPGVEAANGHISEQPVPDALVAHTIINDGSIDDLHRKLLTALTHIERRQ